MHITSPFSPPLSSFAPARTELEMDRLREVAGLHRWLCFLVLLQLPAVLVPGLGLLLAAPYAWVCARLAGALRGEHLRLFHLFLALFPLTGLPQLFVLDRRVRRTFSQYGVKVGFLTVSDLGLAQAEARIRRRSSVPPPAPGARVLVPRPPARLAESVPPDMAKTQLLWSPIAEAPPAQPGVRSTKG